MCRMPARECDYHWRDLALSERRRGGRETEREIERERDGGHDNYITPNAQIREK